jgi:hypothetical protein
VNLPVDVFRFQRSKSSDCSSINLQISSPVLTTHSSHSQLQNDLIAVATHRPAALSLPSIFSLQKNLLPSKISAHDLNSITIFLTDPTITSTCDSSIAHAHSSIQSETWWLCCDCAMFVLVQMLRPPRSGFPAPTRSPKSSNTVSMKKSLPPVASSTGRRPPAQYLVPKKDPPKPVLAYVEPKPDLESKQERPPVEQKSEPKPESEPEPEPKPSELIQPELQPRPALKPESQVVPEPKPVPQVAKPEPKPKPKPKASKPEPKPKPKAQAAKPEPKPKPKPQMVKPEKPVKPDPKRMTKLVKPEPEPQTKPKKPQRQIAPPKPDPQRFATVPSPTHQAPPDQVVTITSRVSVPRSKKLAEEFDI